MSADALEVAILSRLRLLDIETFDRLPDAGGGVGERCITLCGRGNP